MRISSSSISMEMMSLPVPGYRTVCKASFIRLGYNVIVTAKLHHPLYQSKEFVRHVAHGQVNESGSFDDGALVRESVKTELAVIVTHSGVTRTS